MTKSKQPSAAGNARARSGGGLTMNKNVKPGVKAGPASTRVASPAAASNLGNAKGNHTTDSGTFKRPAEPLYTGTRPQVKLGNDLARNVGRGGPGAGYVQHGQSGTQGQHGPSNPGVNSGSPSLGGAGGGAGKPLGPK